MIEQLRIPLIGLVENMSYLVCPDCGKKLYPFGESRSAATAEKIGTRVLARLPLDAALAEKCDAGQVEAIQMKDFEAVVDRVTAWADTREEGSTNREDFSGCAGCAGGGA